MQKNIVNSCNICTNKLELLSEARTSLMGIAIIWIILFHTTKLKLNLPLFIKFPLFTLGDCGVEIFMLLSGFGIFCSLFNNSDELFFYIKRLKKLLPVIPIIIIYAFLIKDYSFQSLVGYILQINFYVTAYSNDLNYNRFWYIPTILLFYFVSPIFFNIINKHISKKLIIILISLSLLFTVPFWNDTYKIVAVCRFTIYLVGFILGWYYCNNMKLPNRFINITYILSIISFFIIAFIYQNIDMFNINIFNYGFIYFIRIFFILGLCFFFSEINKRIKYIKLFTPVNFILKILGENTLEIYLIEALILALYLWEIPYLNNVISRIFFSIIIGLAYSYLCKSIKFLFHKKTSLKGLFKDKYQNEQS